MAPKKKRNEMKHSNIICLRLSDIELELVNHAASQAKLSRSDYLRNLILDHKMAIRYEVVIESNTIKMLLAEYGKIGSNLNQITKYFNTGGAYSKSVTNEIQQCLAEIFLSRWQDAFHQDIEGTKSQPAGTDQPAKIIHPISKGSDTRFKNRRQKCGSNSPQPGSKKTKDTGTRIINHFTKEELQYDTK